MKSKQFSTLFIVFSLAFLVLVGVIVYTIIGKKTEDKQDPFSYKEQQTLGDQDVPVHIVEFADFKCPGCKKWGENVLPKIQQEYIDTGKAQFHFINFPFMGDDSDLGAAAGEAIYKQDPAAFWKFSTALYGAQQSIDQVWITEELLMQIVKEKLPEIDVKQFQKDLNSESIQKKVQQDKDLALGLKVQAAPAIYVNGNLVDANYDGIKNAIEEALEK
jgi:protein-disulfide isomerase